MKKSGTQNQEQLIIKSDLLEDDFLETAGLIKPIDTIALIEKAEQIKKEKHLKLQDTIYALLTVLITFVHIIMIFKFGLRLTLVVDFILSSPIPVLILFYNSKKLRGGSINEFN